MDSFALATSSPSPSAASFNNPHKPNSSSAHSVSRKFQTYPYACHVATTDLRTYGPTAHDRNSLIPSSAVCFAVSSSTPSSSASLFSHSLSLSPQHRLLLATNQGRSLSGTSLVHLRPKRADSRVQLQRKRTLKKTSANSSPEMNTTGSSVGNGIPSSGLEVPGLNPATPSNSSNGDDGKALAQALEQLEKLRLDLEEERERARQAEIEKENALRAVREAEEKAEEYANEIVKRTEEAMAEVESAKISFQVEIAKLEKEKGNVEEQLQAAKLEGLDLALRVERMSSIAVEEQTIAIAEEAKLRIAEARTEAMDAGMQMEEKIRLAADEAAASVIEEARATIEDALSAAEVAKEQARAAERALQDRLKSLDRLEETELRLIETEEETNALTLKLKQYEKEREGLKMELQAAIARAEAAEARIALSESAVAEIQKEAEEAAKRREKSSKTMLDTMREASESRERAALLAYKAETDSLRAAAETALKGEKVKEQTMQRRFAALQKSLQSTTASLTAWKGRALAVEELLTEIDKRGFSVLREAQGSVEDLLNRGRMEVMLGDPSSKFKLLAEGPRRERPEWLQRKTQLDFKMPPLSSATLADNIISDIPLVLPSREEVWKISEHKVVEDVFTKQAEAKELEMKEIDEKRRQLEETLQRKAVKRVRAPSDVEEPLESGTGSGREIVFQGFNWESHRFNWYLEMAPKAAELAASGITTVWLPPPTESVSPQGYMPVDLYNLNSSYGTVEELKFCIDEMHKYDILVLGDVVLNHRCASKQSKEGIWNIFGGKLDWGPEAIVRDDPNFKGKGNPSSGDFFYAAPNIDHSQDFVRAGLKEWLKYLRTDIGYDGWRLDFARGFWGGHVKEYIEASNPAFCIGEFWDTLAYEGGQVAYNQNPHRQRIVNWINATGGTSSAFDVTTKGILQAAVHNEYWRLIDPQGKPPGVMGWWPSRAVTFLDNHDTGSTQAHWPFPRDKMSQGYAYILTHPGTPVVFYDHFYDFGIKDQIKELIAARTHCKIHCRSAIKIFHANAQGYVALVGDHLVLKLGWLDWNPSKQNNLMGRWNKVLDRGNDYQIWEKVGE